MTTTGSIEALNETEAAMITARSTHSLNLVSTTAGAVVEHSTEAMDSSMISVVIGLAVSTGVFFVTTILLCILLMVVTSMRMRQRENEKTKDVVFEGCNQSSHWIDTPTTQTDKDPQQAELPIWSVQTFTTTGNLSSPPSTPNQSSSNTNTSEMTPQNVPPPSLPPASSKKIVPKRVAPPPPKGKKKRKGSGKAPQEAADYAVPVTRHWYNWNKKKSQQKSAYKELDLAKMEGPGIYSTPNAV